MTEPSPTGALGPQDFHRARAIFESALEQPPAERGRFVDHACSGETRLLAAVREMLRADAEPHPFLDGGAMSHADRWQPGDVFASHFRVVSMLGRGGMGEVYRAHDATLGRDVALKVLPTSLLSAGLDDRLARFRREAQMLAALNHPNIAAIYGVAEEGDTRALVLEFIEGRTLAERLVEGSLPLDEAVNIARQIAIGLEAAHEQGIVHRDLKPANISLRGDGVVKLLDFGLAKVVHSDAATVAGVTTISPTITSPSLVDRGIVLGSAAYMSPEQAKGREADRRSDIWAFGAVLYEMLSGERAFKGDDISETLAAVLRADVDGTRVPASTPLAMQQLVARCLDRNAQRRLRDIGEARIVLENVENVSTASPVPEKVVEPVRRPRVRRLVVPLAAAVLGAALVAVALWPAAPASNLPVTRFVLSMRADESLFVDPQSRDLAITPDGTRVVYKGGPRVDATQLFAYQLDQLAPQPITGSGLPKGPFASPDGRWIGFFEPGPDGAALKKVAIGGGPSIHVTRLDGPSRGATWGDDDSIIAASGVSSTGLLRIPANGGEITVLTRPNRQADEGDHLWPQFLPGSQAVLYTITAVNGDIDAARVAVLDLQSGTSKTLIRGASQAHYVSSGHLVYLAGGALWGVSFDAKRLETMGSAAVLVPQIVILPTGVAEFDIARDGTLVYVAKGGTSEAPRTLVWVNRRGEETPISAPPRPYSALRLSPDARRVALEIEDADNDIWVWDFARETLTRVTTSPGLDETPVWTPDGQRLVFTSQAGGVLGSLFWQSADGSGAAERLTDTRVVQRASDVLPDGSGILFSEGTGVQMLTLDGERRVRPLMAPLRFGGDGVVSPDGQWLAYAVSRDVASGRQVFVGSYANPESARTLVSKDGGAQPRWSADGHELFFLGADGTLMSAPVGTGPTLSIGTPTRVISRVYFNGYGLGSRSGNYDVSRDGQRFLMLKQTAGPDQPAQAATVVVVKNWVEELRRLVPSNGR